MFMLTWPIDLANSGVLSFQVPLVVAVFVGYGLVFASLIMTGMTLGKDGVIALLKRFLIWRVGWEWYLVAFLLIPAISLIGIFLNAGLNQTPVDFSTVLAYEIFGRSANLPLLIVPFFLFDAIANGEEIGWRGYVLPRLQVKYTALASSLILGVTWGVWHLPKFLSHWNTVSFAWFMVDVLAKAVLLTWIYNNTEGSLLLVTLFHASFNTAGVLLPIASTVSDSNFSARIVVDLLEITAAVVVVIFAGARRLSLRMEPVQVQAQV
jgi:CAAX protease family protein